MTLVRLPPVPARYGWAALLLAACIAAQTAVLHPRVLFGDEVMTASALAYGVPPWKGRVPADARPLHVNKILSDDMILFTPWDEEVRAAFRAGALPFWSPSSGLGMPLLANNQSAVFAPTHLLRWIWDSPRARSAGLLAKPLLAALGMYLLLARLGAGPLGSCLGALAWSGSAALTVWQLYPLSEALAWMSWLALGLLETLRLDGRGRRRGPLIVAAAVAAILLSGHLPTAAQILAAAAVGTLAALALRRQVLGTLPLLAVAAASGLLLAMPQIVPTASYVLNSRAIAERGSAAPAAAAALPAAALWNWIVPRGFGSPEVFGYLGPLNFNEASASVSLAALALAAVSLLFVRRTAVGLIGAAVLLAGGLAYGLPGIAALDDHVPIVRLAAGQRWTLLAQWGVCLLAGLGVGALPRISRRPLAFAGLGGGAALVTAIFLHPALSMPEASLQSGEAARAILLSASEAVVAAACIAAAAIPRLLPWGRGLLLTSVGLSGILLGWGFNPSIPASARPGPNVLTRALSDAAAGGRVAPLGWALPPNLHVLAGLHSASARDDLIPRGYAEFVRISGLDDPWGHGEPPGDVSLSLLRRSGIRVVWLAGAFDSATLATGALEAIPEASEAGVSAYALADPAPLLGWYGAAIPVADRSRALGTIARGGVDAGIVLLTGRAPDRAGVADEARAAPGSAPSAPGALEPAWTGPNRVAAIVDAPADGWVVFRELAFPGWTATLDGREVPWREADGWFMAVSAPAGRHEIRFAYRPPYWPLALAAVPLGLALLALGWWWVDPRAPASVLRARGGRGRTP